MNKQMTKITEIQIIPVKPNNGLVAFASLVYDGSFYLSSIGIIKKRYSNDFRILYPTKKIGERSINIFHPINKVISKEIEEAILKKAEEILNFDKNVMTTQTNVRHSNYEYNA